MFALGQTRQNQSGHDQLSGAATRHDELAAVGHNDRMIIVKDAVAEMHRDTHAAELKTMQRMFAEFKSTDEVVAMLAGAA